MIRRQGRTIRRLKKLRLKLFPPAFASYGSIVLPLAHTAISPGLRKEIYLGKYELDESRIITETLTSEDIILELGTGLGYLSTLCARMIGSERVHTFEANPNLESVIRQTYSINKVSPNFNVALFSQEQGERDFFVNSDFWSSSLIERRGTVQRVSVPTVAARSWLANVRPTYLICDIEGGEVELLRHMPLDSFNKVCIEIHPHVIDSDLLTEAFSRIVGAGFNCDFRLSRHNVYFFRRCGTRDSALPPHPERT